MSLSFCDNVPLGIAAIVVAVLLAFVLGGKLKFDLFGQSFEIDFSAGRERMRKMGVQPMIGVSSTAVRPAETGYLDLSARDAALQSWGSLKQIIYDLALVRHIPLTPVTETPEAVSRLLNAKVIGQDVAEAILFFHDIGKKIAEQPDVRLDKKSAANFREYQEYIYGLVDLIMGTALRPPPPEEPTPVPRRLTQVGGAFPQPAPAMAGATLVGVAGALRGRAFAVDKERIRIGSDSSNDLCIAGDAYVSGHHAEIRYDQGCLWLSDRHSRNGTMLNGVRLKDAPVVLNVGDRIQVGTSTLEVNRTSGH